MQIVTPGSADTTSAGTYNITQNGYAADKPSKDSNFRGETIFNNTLYVTKGSGGNGINTVYQVGTQGTLPTGSNNAITILPGFTTTLLAANSGCEHVAVRAVLRQRDDAVCDRRGSCPGSSTPQAGLEKWIAERTGRLDRGLCADGGAEHRGELMRSRGWTLRSTRPTQGLRDLVGTVNR